MPLRFSQFRRRLFGAAIVCGLFAGASLPAHASFRCDNSALSKPLTPTIVGSGDARALVLAGGLRSPNSEDSRRGSFADVEAALNRGGYAEIWLCSGGGSVQEGYKLGRYFARRRLKVRVPDGFFCASACTIATMGGYLRTIDTKANFVVHASSGVSGFSDSQPFQYVCGDRDASIDNALVADCQKIRAAISATDLVVCEDSDQFRLRPDSCHYAVEQFRDGTLISMRGTVLIKAFVDPDFIVGVANSHARRELPRLVEMVQYYQLMLNDNDSGAVKRLAYDRAIREHEWKHIADGGSHLNDVMLRHMRRFSEAELVGDLFVIWQDLLTDIEIGQQEAVIEILRAREGELGRGGKQALNIMDAMIICRIQSSCYLDRNALARLGYHNFDMD